MGLKRRGPGRKQVLDLSDKSDSPRRSWQSKYQQICVEHNTQDGSSPETTASVTGGKVVPNNPLSGLIANYNSDSDADDDETNVPGDLNSKVSDFLKEIQTIVPSGSSIVIPGQPLTTPGLGPEEVLSRPQPNVVTTSAAKSAWQQCYDETTGYVYYWNMETNDVTWETPSDYLPEGATQQSNLPAQHGSPLAPAVHGGGVAPQWPHGAYPTMVEAPKQVQSVAQPSQAVLRNKAGRKIVQKQAPVANKMAKGRPKSDSEDERIEMITSFGETSEEESEEEIPPPSKKKKLPPENYSTVHELIGPQLQPTSTLDVSTVESEPCDDGSSLFSHQVDDLGPPGVEPEPPEEKPAVSTSVDNYLDAIEQEMKNVANSNENSSSGFESSVPVTSAATPMGSDDGESLETDEGAILSQIRSQALLLKELGGDLPDEVRQLIEPVHVDSPSEPTDFDKELEQMEKELLEITNAARQAEKVKESIQPTSIEEPEPTSVDTSAIIDVAAATDKPTTVDKPSTAESSRKPTSFALIAGYGDDSEPEEDSDKPVSVGATMPVVKRTFESLPTAPVKSLFPIFDEPVKIPPIVEAAVCEVETKPSSPEPVHSVLFKPPPKDFTISALRLEEPRGTTPERDAVPVASMVDTSMPVKAGKRKKRLDISTSADLVAKAAQALNANVVSDAVTSGSSSVGAVADDVTEESAVEVDVDRGEGAEERKTKRVGGVSFVKAGEEPRVLKREREPSIEEKIAAEAADEESRKQVEDLAQLIIEKVKFLGEGKEPVSPVQVMAIQIEMLVSAWHKRALTQSYLSDWLGKTWEELRRLESAAAPEDWACHWDRTHKRYYYYNMSSGETQWEYPIAADVDEVAIPEEKPEEKLQEEEEKVEEKQRDVVEEPVEADIAGGEQAMEICSTPPPSPPPLPKTPPPPNITPRDPSPPPPPRISPFPPPPPRISPFPPQKNEGHGKRGKKRHSGSSKAKQAKESKGAKAPSKRKTADVEQAPPPPLPPLPPPPPPPPPCELPPLPTSPPPPLPTPPPRLAYGEPLPPGVDPVDLPYLPAPAVPAAAVPPPPPPAVQHQQQDGLANQVMGDEQMMAMMMPMQAYMMPTYQQPMVAAPVMGGPMMDYSAMPYMLQHAHMSVPAVIAKPPAKKHKAALHAALDSFYSDIASMAPAQAEAEPVAAEPAAELPPPVAEAEPAKPVDVPVVARKKKAKKSAATGSLGLKKKGVSSLVAKWQQVQQEVRRDYQTMDDGDDDSS